MFNQTFNYNKNASFLSLSGMPNMANTLDGWMSRLTLIKITQNIIDGDLVQSEQVISFEGCWQPMQPDRLQFLDAGVRSFSWYTIYAKSGTLNLQTADKIIFQNVRYKIMSLEDYSLSGYILYNAILDFQDISLE